MTVKACWEVVDWKGTEMEWHDRDTGVAVTTRESQAMRVPPREPSAGENSKQSIGSCLNIWYCSI